MKVSRLLLNVVIVLLIATSGFGQAMTASLTGTVTMDNTPLPGVTITITAPTLQGTRTTVTDVNGNYNFGALPPGLYTVKFEMESMQTVQKQVNVTLAGTARANSEMKLSTVAEAITVTASAPAVLETTEVQTTVRNELVEQLPSGRTLPAIVDLSPGVTTNGPGGNTVISGAPSYENTYYIDGSVVNEVLRGQSLNTYIEDAIQETTVLTGAISAEYGRFTGGVVTAITKAGGNEFSGSFRDSMTNPAWTAQTPLEEPRPASNLNEVYEGTFGGRILPDRLWFFTAGRYYDRSTQAFLFQSTIPYTTGQKEKRYEVKLTGQVNPKHSLVGSYLEVKRDSTNIAFSAPWEVSAIDPASSRKETSASAHYNGIFTNQFLLEANWNSSKIDFIGDGGPRGDFAHATNVSDQYDGGALGAPTFGSSQFGDNNYRASDDILLKATYYLATSALGTHNLVGGYDQFSENLHENNAQSGSDFTVYNYAPTVRNDAGVTTPTFETGNALIAWWPILFATRGTDFVTRSAFLNDKWDLSRTLSFNVGVRYDKNDAVDSMGQPVSKDSKFSPRLGAIYDVKGDGRIRLSASYSQYAAKIANGNVGDSTSAAGNPSLLYWLYYGPTIEGLPTTEALQQMWDWFQSVGGTDNRTFFDGSGAGYLLGGGTNGISSQIRQSLKSPGVDEFTFGAGTQLGQSAFLRADYQDRKWNNFYVTHVTLDTGTVYDPLAQADIDLGLIQNSNDLERKYKAVILQGGWSPYQRVQIGGNYTWSELKGNVVGETTNSGPVTSSDNGFYPELLAYPNRNPVGYLGADQRHKLRAWISYDQPTPIGTFNFSLLQRFDSGTPYSATGTINVLQRAGGTNPCPQCPANPGYLSFSDGQNYYFSKRGAFRWEDVTSTGLAINYTLPLGKVNLFVQSEVRNLFDESAVINGNNSILTARSSSCKQASNGPTPGARCLAFNPFTETPVEGIHYRYGSAFGKPQSVADYQTPRTYYLSAGVRF